jgi:small GTP-binding protein
MSNKSGIRHKMVLLGDTSVGKSCIVRRLVQDQFWDFQEPTIGSAFTTQTIYTDTHPVNFEIWDTAGQERYRSLAPMYYRGAKVALVVYDITNSDSLNGAKNWVQELKMRGDPDLIVAIVGNKIDMLAFRKITYEEVRGYAIENEILFYESSAKTNINIQEMFVDIAKKIPVPEITENTLETRFKIEPKKVTNNYCCF